MPKLFKSSIISNRKHCPLAILSYPYKNYLTHMYLFSTVQKYFFIILYKCIKKDFSYCTLPLTKLPQKNYEMNLPALFFFTSLLLIKHFQTLSLAISSIFLHVTKSNCYFQNFSVYFFSGTSLRGRN